MNRRIHLVLALVLFSVPSLIAQWQLVARKDGADVRRFYQSSSGTLYAQLSSGMKIFRSYDGGVSWSELQLPQATGVSLFAPCSDSLGLEALVFMNGGTFYRSIDNGFSWQEIPRPSGIQTSEEISGLEGLRYGVLVIAAGSANGVAVYLSRDNGRSAIRIGELPAGQWHFYQAHDSVIYCYGNGLYRIERQSGQLVRLSSDPHTAMVSSQEYSGAPVVLWSIRSGTVVRTTDGGSQWSDASTGLPPLQAGTLLLSGREGAMFCILPDQSGDSSYVYRRFAAATQWSLVSRQRFIVADALSTMSGTLLVATTDGVFSSEESGMFWANSSSGIQGIGLDFAAYVPSVLLIAAATGGNVFRSVNNGLSWTSSLRLPANAHVNDICIRTRDQVLLGTTHGLWCSSDEGVTFARCSTAAGPITDTIVGIAIFRAATIAASTGGIFVSTDGMLWNVVNVPLPVGVRIIALRSNDSVVVVATQHTVIAIDNVAPVGVRLQIPIAETLRWCDIAEDGTIGVVLDSGGTTLYRRYRFDGTVERSVQLPAVTVRSMALSRGGRAWIAAEDDNRFYTVGRTSDTYTLDTSIGEPVLSVRRQTDGALVSTTAYGAVYRAAPDSITSVEFSEPGEILLLPNPASEQVTIIAPGTLVEEVRISDAVGRTVLQATPSVPTPVFVVKLPTIAAGYYIASIRTPSGTVVRMLIVVP